MCLSVSGLTVILMTGHPDCFQVFTIMNGSAVRALEHAALSLSYFLGDIYASGIGRSKGRNDLVTYCEIALQRE